jgi:hypothetical protein
MLESIDGRMKVLQAVAFTTSCGRQHHRARDASDCTLALIAR